MIKFFKNKISLIPSHNNKIGIVFDKAISKDILNVHINTINAVKTIYGCNIVDYDITDENVGVEFSVDKSGISTGNVKNTSSYSYTGGLIGLAGSPGIINSYATGDVEGGGATGGLIGLCNTIHTVFGSYATGNVTGQNNTGGLIGILGNTTGSAGNLTTNRKGIISECYATGTVNGSQAVGGLIGTNSGTIQNSYAINSVSGTKTIGGITGGSSNTVINSYSVGTVSSTYSPYGGIVGSPNAESTTENAFFDSTISNLTLSCGGESASNCTTSYPKTTAEMQTPQTFIDAGWDETIWELVEGQYPKLKNVGGQ